ncbi:zinc finger protein 260-like isoform X21 [Maniola hyperantus]|uniref:zinc finger protein 260-like isoform X21 n=1 Tax=Aphantopus hyperantus TaxID=2795564 RepID=UPI00156843C0|nr:zinc finger protein 260-like isoform X15 [Maniola hyperantus]
MEGVLSDGMCRCCATEGSFKDFQVAYQWMGVEEIYGNMLKDCFDITLSVSEEISNGGICEVCITQLRNACNFKQQVQRTEEKFQKKLQEASFKTEGIKMEISRFEDDDSNISADDFSSPEYEVPIKVEKVEEKPKKRAAAKASTSKAKKTKASEGEPSVKRNQPVHIMKVKVKDEIKYEANVKEADYKGRNRSEVLCKHLINAREIFTWSNATPVRTQSDAGYSCCYCEVVYKHPADLKKHTKDTHKGIEDSNFNKKRDLTAFCVKTDITDLQCLICCKPIENIDVLINHLKNVHKKRLFTDIKNHFIPFKFDTDNLQCCICSNQFQKFKLLLEHMNSHTRNFVCEKCDAGFINRKSLRVHQDQHAEGKFKCALCTDVFSTLAKQKLHIRSAHKPAKFRNRCRICNELFKDYQKKLKHMREVHQVQKTQKCSACERIFTTRKSYSIHMQRDHLMERRHKCLVCDKSFFESTSLKEHMKVHTGERDFQCDVCLKRYGRKTTLREHMRIHADDRRFKCECCGQAFVQKCSWRGHMRAKHGQDC